MVSSDKSDSEAFSFIICAFIIGSHTSLKKASYNMMMFLGCYNFVICKQNTKDPALVTRTSHKSDQSTSRVGDWKPFDEEQMFCCPETLSILRSVHVLTKLGLCMLKLWRIIKMWCNIDIQNPNPAIIIHNNLLFLRLGSRLSLRTVCFYWISWRDNEVKIGINRFIGIVYLRDL